MITLSLFDIYYLFRNHLGVFFVVVGLTLVCWSLREYVYITGTADHVSTPTSFVPSGRRIQGQTTPRRPPTWQSVFSREEVVERCCRRRAVSQRRRPNAVVLILSSSPLFMMLPYGQRSGMERGVLREGRRDTNFAGWETSMEGGSFPLIIENRL